MARTSLGRVQGAGVFYSSAASSTDVAMSTLEPSNIKPLVGDSVLFSNGDIRSTMAVTSISVTCGAVVSNIKGEQGAKGETGSQGVQGFKGDVGPQGVQGPKGDVGQVPTNVVTTDNTAQTISGVKAFSNGVQIGSNWKIDASGTTLRFLYNGAVKMTLYSDGALNIT